MTRSRIHRSSSVHHHSPKKTGSESALCVNPVTPNANLL
jgi:hypothetical protein